MNPLPEPAGSVGSSYMTTSLKGSSKQSTCYEADLPGTNNATCTRIPEGTGFSMEPLTAAPCFETCFKQRMNDRPNPPFGSDNELHALQVAQGLEEVSDACGQPGACLATGLCSFKIAQKQNEWRMLQSTALKLALLLSQELQRPERQNSELQAGREVYSVLLQPGGRGIPGTDLPYSRRASLGKPLI